MLVNDGGIFMALRKGCPKGWVGKNSMCYKFVKSVSELKKLCRDGIFDYALILKGNIRSSKSIDYAAGAKKPFYVDNWIDGSVDNYSEKELQDSLIGEAMKNNVLIAEATPYHFRRKRWQ